MTIDNVIGERIKHLRHEKELVHAELAERAELSISFLSMIERGERIPSVRTIKKLASALNVSTSDLMIDTNIRGVEPLLYPLVEYIKKRGLGPNEIKRLVKVAKAMYGDIPTDNSTPANG